MRNIEQIQEIKDLTLKLNQARDDYYNNSTSIISDYEYDELFDKLKQLEEENGFVMANSPTHFVGYEVKSKLQKVEHNHHMLSLDKTKSIGNLIKFAGDNEMILMQKLDGLTISLEYNNGVFTKAETRGDGIQGEDVTHNALVIKNIPKKINHIDKLIVDGEAIITYDDFEKINSKLEEKDKYKNPRNLVSGSIRQLDNKIAEQRNIKFIAWKCIEGLDNNSHLEQLYDLEDLGFEVVSSWKYKNKTHNIEKETEYLNIIIDQLKREAKDENIPIDGMVLGYDDISYGKTLGQTSHHLNSQIAFKFYNEETTTNLIDVEWSMGKTGSLNPVAIFEPCEIDGTTVTRASLHNVSIFKEFKLGVDDEITVIKANEIIPQVTSNLTKSNTLEVPSVCPICGKPTTIIKDNKSEILYCSNPNCKGKLLGRLVNFCSKSAMNIEGLSEATLETFIEKGWLKTFQDIYMLSRYKNEIINTEGFGDKSYNKLIQNIEQSRNVKFENYLVALGIPNVGKTASKTISKYFNGNYYRFLDALADDFDFTQLQDIGETINNNLYKWFNDNNDIYGNLNVEINFILPQYQTEVKANPFQNKIVVVTGTLQNFTRTSIQEKLEELGAKVSNSVSKKTDYLIYGESAGSKLNKAKELKVTIISENEFLQSI